MFKVLNNGIIFLDVDCFDTFFLGQQLKHVHHPSNSTCPFPLEKQCDSCFDILLRNHSSHAGCGHTVRFEEFCTYWKKFSSFQVRWKGPGGPHVRYKKNWKLVKILLMLIIFYKMILIMMLYSNFDFT